MIKVTRLKGTQMVVNAELIELIEETPDTVITLTTGHKVIVEETVDQVINAVVRYRREAYCSRGTQSRRRAP